MNSVTFTNAGYVTVTQTGTNVTVPVVEQHYFFPRQTSSATGQVGGITSAGIGGAAADLQFPPGQGTMNGIDPAEGKEWQTIVPGISATQHVYGPTATDFKVCQSNTTLLDAAPNQTAGRIFLYGAFDNPTDTYEYDFGSAPGITVASDSFHNSFSVCPAGFSGYARHTNTTYNGAATYTAAPVHIVGLPASVTTYTAGGGMAAQTGYEYDTYTGTHRAALVSYGGSGLPGYNGGMLSVTARGNVTATSRYLNTTGSNVTTYAQYDVFGNVVAAVDGNVNTTSYAYCGDLWLWLSDDGDLSDRQRDYTVNVDWRGT